MTAGKPTTGHDHGGHGNSCCSHKGQTAGTTSHDHTHPDHARHEHMDHERSGLNQAAAAADKVKDPVCGMSVDPHTAKHHADHQGKPYYFCSAGCQAKFAADPTKYVKPEKAKVVPAGTIYTCPMHPQIRQVGPGFCPICGMALEPEIVTAEAQPNVELQDMTRRLWVGLALAVPVFILEMGNHLFNLHHIISPTVSNWVQLVLATPVVLWAGFPFFERGWKSLETRNLNMFTLIALGTGVAWAYSVVATLLPGHLSRGAARDGRRRAGLF